MISEKGCVAVGGTNAPNNFYSPFGGVKHLFIYLITRWSDDG